MNKADLSFIQFIRLVLDAVEAAQIEYMLGGSVALSIWGQSRSTLDVDFVINLPLEQAYQFSLELKARDMLVPLDIIMDLYMQEENDLPINAIHLYAGHKAELFLLRPDDELRMTALLRRRLADFGPVIGKAYVHAPEDLIVYKLRYYVMSEQTKHMRDIKSILSAKGVNLEMDYIEEWVRRYGLSSAWYKARHWQE